MLKVYNKDTRMTFWHYSSVFTINIENVYQVILLNSQECIFVKEVLAFGTKREFGILLNWISCRPFSWMFFSEI